VKRLESWKQIAAYLGKDIRTAQLWEKNEGLPIHRQTHTARANVFAYDAELDAWVRARQSPPAAVAVDRVSRRWPLRVGIGAGLLGLALVLALAVRPRERLPAAGAVVAVLPFTDLGGSDDHLADGLTDDIIVTLGRAGKLPIISRTSTAGFRQTSVSLPRIAEALHATAVVEGTLQRSGNHVRITADLVDVRTDRRLWSEDYERDLSDVLSVQDEVAAAISGSVLERLTGQASPKLRSTRPVDPDARLAYLTGRYFWAKRNEAGLTKAIAYFTQAIAKDSLYAPAYSGLADSYTLLSVWGSLSSRDAFPKAEAAARRALALDSNSAEAYTSLAIVTARWDWNFAGADADFRRAIAANPNYATAHQWYGEFLGDLGRGDTSIAESRRAVALDPLSAIAGGDLAVAYIHAGRAKDAVAELRRVLAFQPDFEPAHDYLGSAYLELGDFQQAEAEVRAVTRLMRDTTRLGILHIYEKLAGGQKQEAIDEAEAILRGAKEAEFGPYQVAQIYFTVGENEKGYAALERAYRDHDWVMVNLLVDEGFAPVRREPRFRAMVRRVGLPTA
jgi:TolB-like protein/Flp pilus assembly protein TadD